MNTETTLLQTAMHKASLTDYLTGVKRTNFNSLAVMAYSEDDWQEAAKQALLARRLHFLDVLPDTLLTAIANGSINVQQTAKELL